MGTFIDLTGQRFGRLTVLSYTMTLTGCPGWVCRCDCGTLKIINGQHLRENKVRSCGCIGKRNRYVEYEGRTVSMKELSEMCGIDRGVLYARLNYGYTVEDAVTIPVKGRRIIEYDGERHTISEWAKIYGIEYSALYYLVRMDGWDLGKAVHTLTHGKKMRKFKKNMTERLIEHNGEKRIVSEWARIYDMEPSTLYSRLKLGWSFDKAVNTPVRTYNRILRV